MTNADIFRFMVGIALLAAGASYALTPAINALNRWQTKRYLRFIEDPSEVKR